MLREATRGGAFNGRRKDHGFPSESPTFLPSVQLVADNVAGFGNRFRGTPVRVVFSWGEGKPYLVGNMVEKYAPPEPIETVRQRRFDFLVRAGMEPSPRVVQFTTRKRNGSPQIQEITGAIMQDHALFEHTLYDEVVPRQLLVGSDFTFTRDPKVVLSVYPADCHVSVIHGKRQVDGRTENVVGLLHAGHQEIADGLPIRAIERLASLGFDPRDMVIGITPGLAPQNYFFKDKDVSRLGEGWGLHLEPVEDHPQGGRGVLVDALGRLLDMYAETGVQMSNVTAHDRSIDTFAAQNETYSHRRAVFMGQPIEDQGRIIVAAQLIS